MAVMSTTMARREGCIVTSSIPRRDETFAGKPVANKVQAAVRAHFAAHGSRTSVARVYETGGLRLRHPRGAACEAVIVNTGGGFAGGDAAEIRIEATAGADATVTTQAAEKIYRADGRPTEIDVSLRLAPGSRLDWLTQEAILFDGACLHRRFDVAMAADAALLLVESLVFGRLAKGEAAICGSVRDSWRIRREERLIFAEELRLDGAIGSMLDRSAIGKGARATAILLHVAPGAAEKLDAVRAALEPMTGVDYGASAWNGMLVTRIASPSPAEVRAAIVAAMVPLRGRALPRVWA
jgi:urease accessory protein